MVQRTPTRTTRLLAEVAQFAESDEGRKPAHFLAVIRSYYPDLKIHIFETKGRMITPVESQANIDKLAEEKDVNACLSDRREMEIKSEDQTTFLVPVLVNNSSAMLVIANRKTGQRVDMVEFVTLIRAYGNVLSIVQASERDTLTGLFNRRMLDRRLPELMSGLLSPRRRTSDPVTAHLAILDIDRFKKINDKHGHLYGDEVLLLFSGMMKQSFRSSDLLVRYGGEEFVVVLTDTTLANCLMVLERFRDKVEHYWFPQIGHVTISIGVVRIGTQAMPSVAIDQADQALYYAKGSGRNRVCEYEDLVKRSLIAVHAPLSGDVELFNEKRRKPSRRKSAPLAKRPRRQKSS